METLGLGCVAAGVAAAVGVGVGIYKLASSCIPADTLVTAILAVGGAPQVVPIEAVPQGAKVLTSKGYSPVYLYTHMETARWSEFKRLKTVSGHVVELSPQHYIHAGGAYAMAANVKAGMSVFVSNGHGGLESTAIASVSNVFKRGAFDPATLAGDLVVHAKQGGGAYTPSTFEGIVISDMSAWIAEPYVPERFIPPLYHAVLAPVRGLFYVSPAWVKRFHTMSYELIQASNALGNATDGYRAVGRTLNSLGAYTLLQLAAHSSQPASNKFVSEHESKCQATLQ